MPGALPIAGVSAGNQLKIGTPNVAKATLSFAPSGFDSARVSFQHSIYFSGQIGATVWLSFDQPYTQPSTLNVPFVFAGYLVAAGISAGTATQFGTTKLTKSAQDFAPIGWDSFICRTARVWNYILNSGASVDFPFTDSYTSITIYNLPFYFGGNPVVGGASAGTQTQFGRIQEVRKPLQISPVGFINRVSQVGNARVGRFPPVNFSFVDSYLKPTALNTPFYFGDALVISAGNLASLQVGIPKATKFAQDFTPTGWNSLSVGRQSTFFFGQTGAAVNFSFVSSYVKPSTLNVPYYFAGLINANPLAWDSSEFGSLWISNYTRYLLPAGDNYSAIGNHNIVNDIEFGVVPTGIYQSALGVPSVEIQLLVIANATAGLQTQFGTTKVAIVVKQYVNPTGYIATKWGVPYVDYFNRYLTVPGNVFTKWGVPWASHYTRYIYQPTGTPATKWGTASVFTRQYVLTLGTETLGFGLSAIDWQNVLRPDGINSLSIGTAWSSHSPRYVAVYPTAPHTRYGVSELRNVRQYIVCTPDPMWDHVSNRGFGPYLEIRNLARALVPAGISSLRMGIGADVYNNSWLVFPVPIPPTAIPTIGSISNSQRFVGPYGYDLATVGELPFVSLAIRYLTAFGFRPTAFGVNQLLQGDAPFGAKGWQQTRYGQPTVIEWSRKIRPLNFNAKFTEWGSHEIYLDVPRYLVASGIEGTQWGTQVIHHFIQNIYQHYPEGGNHFGLPQAIFRNRRIYPTWFIASQYGNAVVSRDVALFLPSILSFGAGIPDVRWGNVAAPGGFSLTTFGTGLWVSRSPRVINCNFAVSTTEWGIPKLKNIRQYLVQYEDPNWFRPYNRGFGQSASIVNADREVFVVGWLSDRLGVGTNVLNAARQILPLSLQPTSDPRIAFIAPYQRYVYPVGLNSLWISWYGAIYNDAFALYPTGISSTVVIPKVFYVESNKRFVKTHTGSDTQWGSHMIAFRIRTVNVYLGKDFMKFGLDTLIGLFEQHFPIEGKDFGKVGTPVVLGPFKKEIRPRWYKGLDWFGYPLVKNKIPQAFTQGWLSFDPGMSKHWVSFRVRSVVIPGFGPDTMFGRLSIKDRKQTVFMIGQSTFGMPTTHRIKNVLPDAPSEQIVLARGFSIFDIALGSSGAGRPVVQGMPTPEGINSLKFGTLWIRKQGCVTKWEWPSSQWSFGIPKLNPAQYIDLEDKSNLKNLHTQWGKPRVSPHTIWCRLDTPEQARLNHPGDPFHELDAYLEGLGSGVGPWWGNAFVSDGAPRYLRPYHNLTPPNQSRVIGGWVSSDLKIESSIRFIYPSGSKQSKFGYPSFPTIKELWAGNIQFTQMGEPSVGFPEGWTWIQYIQATMGVVSQWGTTRVELFNRSIYMTGSSMTQWGNNTPMVHFPRIVYPQGLNASQFGDNKPTYRIRYLMAEGFDSFLSEYELEFLSSQLRVRWKTNPVYATASDMSRVGLPTIGLKYQYIRPYQIIGSRCLGHNVIVSRGQ